MQKVVKLKNGMRKLFKRKSKSSLEKKYFDLRMTKKTSGIEKPHMR